MNSVSIALFQTQALLPLQPQLTYHNFTHASANRIIQKGLLTIIPNFFKSRTGGSSKKGVRVRVRTINTNITINFQTR